MKRFIIAVVCGYALIGALIFITLKVGARKEIGTAKKSSAETIQKEGRREDEGLTSAAGGNRPQPKVSAPKTAEAPAALKKKGSFKSYYSNGRVSSVWPFEDGLLNGTGFFYHENGELWFEVSWIKGTENGEVVYRDESGRKMESTHYAAGIFHGERVIYYHDAARWVEESWNEGRLQRFPVLFSENGERMSPAPELAASQITEGTGAFRSLTDKGRFKSEWLSDGETRYLTVHTYYLGDQLSSQWELDYEKLTGHVTFKTPEGKLLKDFNLTLGAVDGNISEYYADGTLRSSTAYAGGVRDGWTRFYYADSSLWFERFYENGIPKGMPRVYSEGREKPVSGPAAVSPE